MSHRTKKGEVNPDGVVLDIDWARFTPGTSMFIPAVNTYRAVVPSCNRGRQVWGTDLADNVIRYEFIILLVENLAPRLGGVFLL